MFIKKNGFTLAEVLIVLVVVGVISVLTIQTLVMQKTQFAFTCYHFFRDLKITIGHMAASTFAGSLNSFCCDRALETYIDDEDYKACIAAGKSGNTDTYILDYRTGSGFCQGLAINMSTASAIKCNAGDLYNATLENIYGSITAESAENFRLMNKFLVYVSDRVVPSGTGAAKPYRIITVDLNGNSSPNKTGEDIISFAIFDSGEVLPLGEAAVNKNYFRAVIKMRNILEMPKESAQTVINSMRHPSAIIMTDDVTPLTFKDAYCKVYGSSVNDPSYCSGYTDFSEKFKLTATEGGSSSEIEVPVTICTQDKYDAAGKPLQKVNGKEFVAECEFNVIKPQVSKFMPIAQDVYSSVGNEEDIDTGSGEANQIYKY